MNETAAPEEDPSQSHWKRWGRATATTVGVIAAILGIGFSAWSAHQTTVAQRQTRRATQLGLITQLDGAANDSERAINDSAIPNKLCDKRFVLLTHEETASLFAALGHFEYFAWLSNTNQLDEITTARSYWARRMLDAYNVASNWFTAGELKQDFPELTTFRRATPRPLWPRARCS